MTNGHATENLRAYRDLKNALSEVAKPDCMFMKLLAGIERDKGPKAAMHLLVRIDDTLQEGTTPLKLNGYERHLLIGECIPLEKRKQVYTLHRRGFLAASLAGWTLGATLENHWRTSNLLQPLRTRVEKLGQKRRNVNWQEYEAIDQETQRWVDNMGTVINRTLPYEAGGATVALCAAYYGLEKGSLARATFEDILHTYLVQADQLLNLAYLHLVKADTDENARQSLSR
jgi:hypothetical protein